MRKKQFILLLCVLFLFLPALLHAKLLDRVVAEINDDVITLSELNEEGREFFKRIKEQAPADELPAALKNARQEILSRLIDKKIIAQKAAALGVSVSDAEIDEAIDRIMVRNKSTIADFRRELKAAGLSEAKYRDTIRDQIVQSKLINYEVRSKIVVTEKKIKEYYAKKYTKSITAGGFYILQMGFVWGDQGKGGNKEEARRRAEQIRSQVLAGENFRDLAKRFSDLPSAVDGGDLGVLQENEMASYMRDTIVALPPGKVSAIVETDSGYQFFKLLSKQEGDIITQAPYDSVKKEIEERLYQDEMQKQYAKWVKKLREQAYVKQLLKL